MKNIYLCLLLIPTFAALYGSCQLGNVLLGVLGMAGIAVVTLGALAKDGK